MCQWAAAAEAGESLFVVCIVFLVTYSDDPISDIMVFIFSPLCSGGGGGGGGAAAVEEKEEEKEEEEEADIGGGMDMFGGEEGGDY